MKLTGTQLFGRTGQVAASPAATTTATQRTDETSNPTASSSSDAASSTGSGLNFLATQKDWSQTAGNDTGLAGTELFEEPQTTVYDMPDSATPANMPNLPAAKYVASAGDYNIGADAFAKACSEALYVGEQPGGADAVQAWLGSFQNPALQAGVENFLAQNAGRDPNDIIDAYGNFNNDLLQQAKAFYPTSNTPAPTASTASTPDSATTGSSDGTTASTESSDSAAATTTSSSDSSTTSSSDSSTTSSSDTATTSSSDTATTSSSDTATTSSSDSATTAGSSDAAASTAATATTPVFGTDVASQAAQAVAQIPAGTDVSTTSLNAYAQAALWALNESSANSGNYQAFMASIQNPQVKATLGNFVQANAGQSAFNPDGTYDTDMYHVATYSDPQFGVDEGQADQKTAAATLAQPKGDITPQDFATTAAYMLGEYKKPDHGNYQALLNLCTDPSLATALDSAVQANASQDPQTDAQGNAQNQDLLTGLASGYANAKDPSTWQAQTSGSAQQTYSQWAQTSTYPEVQDAAKKVVADNQTLSDAQQQLDTANRGLSLAQTNLEAPDASGAMQPLSYWQDQQTQAAKSLQSAWETSRADEAQFWFKLNGATGGAAQSAYDPYTTNLNYTTEGVMPQGFASAELPTSSAATTTADDSLQTGSSGSTGSSSSSDSSTGGSGSTGSSSSSDSSTVSSGSTGSSSFSGFSTGSSGSTGSSPSTPSSSSGSSTTPATPTSTGVTLPNLGTSPSWPANAVSEVNNPTAMGSMSQSDFTQLTESFAQLYNQNPATYFSTLAQVKDSALSGAINFAVNDSALYNAKDLRVNGASEQTEQGQYAHYYKDAKAGGFRNWSPSAQTPAGASTAPGPSNPAQLFPAAASGDKAAQNAITAMNATAPFAQNGVTKEVFGGAAASFANLYKSNPAQYYQALSQVKDPQLRDGLNYAVLDTLSNHASQAGSDSWYQGLYGKAGHTGYAGTPNNLTTNSRGTTLNGGGPLNGQPWKP